MIYFIKNFAKISGLPDIQCKTDFKNNVTWLRIPELMECNLISKPEPVMDKPIEKAKHDTPNIVTDNNNVDELAEEFNEFLHL